MTDTFTIIQGIKPILLSAPHVYPHHRPGFTKKPKKGELYTDVIVQDATKVLDAYGIFTTSIQSKDPNWYPSSPYRKKVIQLCKHNSIGYFFDIHGLAFERKEDIMLFVNKLDEEGVIKASQIAKRLQKNFSNVVIKDFKHNKQVTLSEQVFADCNIASIQCEINYALRKSAEDRKFVISCLELQR